MVAPQLSAFVNEKVLPGTGVDAERFWQGLEDIVRELSPRNNLLLERRDTIQEHIDDAYRQGHSENASSVTFLHKLGYLAPAADLGFEVETQNVDDEIASIAGPQLVCPVDNGRFILNAANARWGSLLDALYGTNAILDAPAHGGKGYDAQRGAQVYDAVHRILDSHFPLAMGRWSEVSQLKVNDGRLEATIERTIVDHAEDHIGRALDGSAGLQTSAVGLADAAQLVGYNAASEETGRWSVLLHRNGLHLELVLGPPGLGRASRAGLVDVQLESALSTICDFEDSACTVDAEDKVGAYANWLGLMTRNLAVDVVKPDGSITKRTLAPPRTWARVDNGRVFSLPGQSLLLARNVGMHMMTDAVVTTADGQPIPEHFLDALVTAACAIHDLRPTAGVGGGSDTPAERGRGRNSARGSVYIVKPKMHGPEEVALAAELFGRVEAVLGLPRLTLKMGVMDEERRTSANLAQCLEAVKGRIVFVNTGFLDRTADEIHTCMHLGAVRPKGAIKGSAWYPAYERGNVATALAHRLVGKGQIGKGMWAEPDDMRTMLETKGSQLEAGASCAWVPSPTAATLHALHYLERSVADTQAVLAKVQRLAATSTSAASAGSGGQFLEELLTPPVMSDEERAALTASEVQSELDNNAQSLLGYVVRWVGQGVGCSKVPDLEGTQLMEDRATLRISSQHIANWLHHGVVSEAQVMETLKRVCVLVDEQNAADPSYHAMAPHYYSPEWHCALELIFNGVHAPNGYTEPALTRWRRERKALDAASRQRASEAVEHLTGKITLSSERVPYRRRGNSYSGAA